MRNPLSWLGFVWKRKERERALQEELDFHLEEEAADREAEGCDPARARREARLDFGNPAAIKESTREAWGWTRLETWGQDLRYGLRSLRRSPAFALTAVVSLALGIGANTAIYSIVNAVMLQTLPVKDPQELVRLEIAGKAFGLAFTNPLWDAIRDADDAFTGLIAYSEDRFDLSDGGEGRFVRGLWVSGGYFDVLGVPALRGRVLNANDDRRGCGADGPVAVISHGFWEREFGSNPHVLGQRLRLNRQAFTIVGITPAWMKGMSRDLPYDVAVPIGCEALLNAQNSKLDQRSSWWLYIVGRLKSGVTLETAEARLRAAAPAMFRATAPQYWSPAAQKKYMSYGLALTPAAHGFSEVGIHYKTALFALMGIAALVLLIACANIANLLLARAAARQAEFSMRMAVGAGRGRLIRQLLTESVLLAAVGAVGGLALAMWGGKVLAGYLTISPLSKSPVEIDVSPDLYVLGYTVGVALLTALLFGFAPALRAASGKPTDALKELGRGGVGASRRFRLGRSLAAAQIGVSFILVLAAGLFVGTLRNLMNTDLGFKADGVMLVNVDARRAAKNGDERVTLHRDVLHRLRKLPGVASVSASGLVPLGRNTWNEWIASDGYGGAPGPDALLYMNAVSPGYFQTMGTRFIAGRDLNEFDGATSTPVMILNESAARRFFGATTAIGRTVRIGNAANGVRFQVIGVVQDAKYERVQEKAPIAGFLPLQVVPAPTYTYELRHTGPASVLTPVVRSTIAAVSRDIGIEFQSLSTHVDASVQQQRVLAALSVLFGGLALLLSMVGLYGVTAYSVAQRRAEIGLRMALGARTNSVLWLVLREAAVLLGSGIALGLAGALALGRLLATLLYELKPNDPAQILVAAAMLAGATALAAFLPAWSAARLDPMRALRDS